MRDSRHGNNLVHMCASVKGAEAEIAERALCIENHWKRTSLQLDFLRRVWQCLDEEHQTIQKQILHVLIGKLTIAVSKIDGLVVGKKPTTSSVKDQQQQVPGVKRWKYAILKEGLDRTIEDLETWQKMFDPSWFLILMASSPQIDAELTRHNETSTSLLLSSTQMLRNTLRGNAPPEGSVFLPPDGLRSARILDIPFSSSKIAQRAGSSKLFILDSVPCTAQGVQRATSDVRQLARKLSHADPIQFGLLKCYGVVRKLAPQSTQQMSFTFILRTVEGLSVPQSLRASLIGGETNHSLSDRLDIAKDLAKSISFVHTFGFVHKNVRPENILVSTDKPSSLGHSFLVGFEEFRTAEGHTLRFGDCAWEKNLYRHPRRQGPRPDDYYIMQHDIYSLGVCMLEVGMWESFVFYVNEDGTCVPSPILGALSGGSSVWEPVLAKDILLSLARAVLPTRMGTKYARIVETCLTCLDEENADFGDEREFQDADGVLVGVRYIEKVRVAIKPHTIPNITHTFRCFCNSTTSQCNWT